MKATEPLQRFCLWLVIDGPWNLGRLGPWVFAWGIGRWMPGKRVG